jgi:hypothetical protein
MMASITFPRITTPILVVNGRYDTPSDPFESSQKRSSFDLLGTGSEPTSVSSAMTSPHMAALGNEGKRDRSRTGSIDISGLCVSSACV